ncbi:SDR family NAD(P)-dependent oxidoreductase [Haliea sp.]|jgi:NAD(P)-dependent dehydrogenase (short-subunit alcohol dehydrogenase family)|uniref:SDR family NAD(P)-dependent oxidoreductase n=2 Tax=Haliea TaxID=475794 RepID=UPI000C6401DA|nr:SDR family NAD(P)-dependent oxidoreductase [Haliea sp.]MAY94805.1 short-chain dehydrogenase [Haliea sp.]MBP70406.1 short-chain dehydrogenase [Haliea sp.]HCD54524.1 short-chain dehydrogenase [Halieaceae bacterium]|tara:strand:+ start:2056 stop:2916 length:861 start_codon:yes stop_codon:yes gene_type:complete
METSMERLRGGVAVITGAGSGIGEGLARVAAEQGMRVVVADIAEDRAQLVAESIRDQGGEAMAVRVDVADSASIDALAATTHDTWGDVTLLINNAGVETLGLTWELSAAQWDKTLNINIHGAIHGVRAFAPRMIASGQPAWIANTASIGGLGMMPVQTSYILSKHAMISFSECLFLEMQISKAPIQVSAVLPGPVATRIFEDGGTTTNSASEQHRVMMQGMLASDGISGYEAAQRILPQIAAGEFWVSTHPELTREFAAGRAAHLSTLQLPALPEEVLKGMGLSID